MSFLFPSFLWATALAAIPIVIHFFNFQRARKVYFTNVALLKTVKETTNAKSRWKDIIVMLMRILFITCLALAFAQPFIDQGDGKAPSSFVHVYMDNSLSMENEQANRPMLNMAQNFGAKITELFPKKTRYQLLDNTFSGGSNYYLTQDKFEEKAFEVAYGNSGRNFQTVHERQLMAWDKNQGTGSSDFFFISDFQKSTTGSLQDLDIDTLHNYHLVHIEPTSRVNISIDTAYLDKPVIRVNEQNTIKVSIKNHSEEKAENLNIKFFIGDQQASANTINVEAGSFELLEMTFQISDASPKACRIEIEDYPVSFDNSYFFTLQAAPEVKVVTISGKDNIYLRDVFSGEDVFSSTHFLLGSIDYSAIAEADLIVLESVSPLPPSLTQAILDASERGGSIAIFPPSDIDQAQYESLTQIALYPKKVLPQDVMTGLDIPSDNNPFFDGVFEKLDQRMEMPTAIPVLGWNGGSPILKFKTGLPFMSKFTWGNGEMFIFASPLDKNSTSLPRHALFVPIMYRAALSQQKETGKLAWSFDEKNANILLDSLGKGDIFQLGGTGLIPVQRASGNTLILEIPKSGLAPGVYDLIHTKSKKSWAKIAFNTGKQESHLDAYSLEELKETFEGHKNVHVFAAADESRFAKAFIAENKAYPLWRQFLIAGLLFLLIEVLLIRFLGRKAF